MSPQPAVKMQPDRHDCSGLPELTHRPLDGLRVIALFKFLKAVLLIATGYGVHLLLNVTRLARLYGWVDTLTDSFAQRMLLRALGWVEGLGATRIHIVVGVTLGYTAVVLAEGIGLWMRRAWAEWFTVIATASLIPFELWELITRAPNRRPAVLVTLLINAGVVWYLVWLLRRMSHHPAGAHSR
ncbi:MAG: DUF2127 domain-containing protein [Steroidobacteraceae bacterium]